MKSIGPMPFIYASLWVVGIAVGVIILAWLFYIISNAVLKRRKNGWGWGRDEPFGEVIVTVIAGLVALFAAAFSLMNLYPYDGKYHNWYTLDTTISDIEVVYQAGSRTITDSYVLTVEDFDRPLVFTDQRILTLNPGDDIEVVCRVDYVAHGVAADQWFCSLVNY